MFLFTKIAWMFFFGVSLLLFFYAKIESFRHLKKRLSLRYGTTFSTQVNCPVKWLECAKPILLRDNVNFKGSEGIGQHAFKHNAACITVLLPGCESLRFNGISRCRDLRYNNLAKILFIQIQLCTTTQQPKKWPKIVFCKFCN